MDAGTAFAILSSLGRHEAGFHAATNLPILFALQASSETGNMSAKRTAQGDRIPLLNGRKSQFRRRILL
jgi:hypothetical protein